MPRLSSPSHGPPPPSAPPSGTYPFLRLGRCAALQRFRANTGLATYAFGLSLAAGQNGQLFTLFTVKVFEGAAYSRPAP